MSGLARAIAYGTTRYPDRVARRLRALNVAVWIGAGISLLTAVNLAATDWSRYKWLAALNAFNAAVWAATPLLHRFGPLAAPVVLALTVCAANAVLAVLIGRDSGIHLWLLATAPLGVIFFGIERRLLLGSLLTLAAALLVGVQIAVPPRSAILSVDPDLIATFHVTALIGGFLTVAIGVVYAVRQIDVAEAALEREFARSESLLANILPGPVAARLKAGRERIIADHFAEASILFADIVGFTERAGRWPPDRLIGFLNTAFSAADALVERHGLEKIKTVGDAYMVVSGVPVARADHAEALARFALDLLAMAAGLRDPDGAAVALRIGIATGPVVAGVVGTRKFAYDVWGDAVNVAARMEANGRPGRIHVSAAAHAKLRERFQFAEPRTLEVRGKGRMDTWFLVAERPETP